MPRFKQIRVTVPEKTVFCVAIVEKMLPSLDEIEAGGPAEWLTIV
jgi:hypothetical protein